MCSTFSQIFSYFFVSAEKRARDAETNALEFVPREKQAAGNAAQNATRAQIPGTL